MKYYYIREYDHDEIFMEYVVRGDDIDSVIKKYSDFRVKNYQEELIIEINKNPNIYNIYKGDAMVKFDNDLYQEFEITIKEIEMENDILILNY